MRTVAAVFALVATASSILAACSTSSTYAPEVTSPAETTPSAPPVVFAMTDLRYDGRVLRVEVASTPQQSERGLGYRDSLASDAGMIFDLHATKVPVFW